MGEEGTTDVSPGKAPTIKIINLGSGSRGNSTIICHNDKILMIDCGFSRRQLVQRMAALGLDPQDVCGILVTHEHTDHITGARVFCQVTNAPILATKGTLSGGDLTTMKTHALQCGAQVDHQGFGVTPIRVTHDTKEPCAYLVEVDGTRSLFATDIGTTKDLDISPLGDLDFLYVEANHDEDMLRDGPYPAFLKKRIASKKGHLNNRESGEFIKSLARRSPELKAIMLAHLSDKNNTPELALETARDYAGGVTDARWVVAHQVEAVELA